MKTTFTNIPLADRTRLRQAARADMDKQHPTPQEFTYYESMDRYVANINDHEFIIVRGELQYWWYKKNTEQCVVLTVNEEWAEELLDQMLKRV